jgi:hypothetical protein
MALGWILQLVLVALGFFEPMMFVVGGILLVTWFFAIRTGARLDRENVQRDREQAEWERSHPGAGPVEPGAAGDGA